MDRMRILLFPLAVLLLLLRVSLTLAQSGGYDLRWWTVDGGGGSSSEGVYTLTGTIGQPDAGAMQGGSYTLRGGFWGGGSIPGGGPYRVYLPLVVKE